MDENMKNASPAVASGGVATAEKDAPENPAAQGMSPKAAPVEKGETTGRGDAAPKAAPAGKTENKDNGALLTVSSSPHISSGRRTRGIMADVLIALLPACIAGCVIFGMRSLAVIAACVASSVATEFVFNLICKKKQTIGDLSAAVTGLLLGLNMHAAVPIWQCVLGGVLAIFVVKCIFGGLGCNFANPAITARVFLLIAFPAVAGGALPIAMTGGELLTTSATPLVTASGLLSSVPPTSFLDLFLGNHAGAIGETCIIALLAGFIYLVVRRVINWYVPAAFVGTVFVCALLFGGFDAALALRQVLSGGLIFGAVFMATDYVTTPITRSGRVIFAVGCGLITSLIRFFGAYPEGVSFAILLMNILSPYIEKATLPRPMGRRREVKK